MIATLIAAVQASSDPARRKPVAGEPPHAAYPSLHDARVLVVDDQEDARLLVRTVLVRCGATVATASSAAEAIEVFAREGADIIVSDIAMPDADGYQFLRDIRARNATVPVVAMTAFSHPRDQEKILAAGFTAYLRKPVEPLDLAVEVHRVLQGTRAAK